MELSGTSATFLEPTHHHFHSKPSTNDLKHVNNAAMYLDVYWTSAETRQQCSKRLPLASISSVNDLRGLFRALIHGAYPGGYAALPDYLTSPDYRKFAPAEEFTAFPGDAINTQFRLVAALQGWELCIAERDLGRVRDDGEEMKRLLITVAEFEGEPVELSDGTEVIVTMITYPTISVQRSFLDEALQRLTAMVDNKSLPESSQNNNSIGMLDDDASSNSAATGAQLTI